MCPTFIHISNWGAFAKAILSVTTQPRRITRKEAAAAKLDLPNMEVNAMAL